jgi:hypothetical protein
MTSGNKTSLDVAYTAGTLHTSGYSLCYTWHRTGLCAAERAALPVATEKPSSPLYGEQFRDTRAPCTIQIVTANSMGECAHPMQKFRLRRTHCVQTVLGTGKWSNSRRSGPDTICSLHDLFCRNITNSNWIIKQNYSSTAHNDALDLLVVSVMKLASHDPAVGTGWTDKCIGAESNHVQCCGQHTI